MYIVDKTRFTKDKKLKYKRVPQFIRCIWGSRQFANLKGQYFDEFLFFNWDMFTHWVFASITRRNRDIKVLAYEEGLISYERVCMYKNENARLNYRLVRAVRSTFGFPNMYDRIEGFFCFHPSLYKGEFRVYAIPHISNEDKELKKLFCRVFSIDESTLSYNQKVIYFSSLLDTEGEGTAFGEVEIAKKIERIIGKDNFLVKLHPRDDKGRYASQGISIDQNSRVPFEVIQLVHDFSDSIFITAMSGVVLTINTILSNPPKILFVYDLYNAHSPFIEYWSEKYTELIQNLKESGALQTCTIIHDDEGLKKYLQTVRYNQSKKRCK